MTFDPFLLDVRDGKITGISPLLSQWVENSKLSPIILSNYNTCVFEQRNKIKMEVLRLTSSNISSSSTSFSPWLENGVVRLALDIFDSMVGEAGDHVKSAPSLLGEEANDIFLDKYRSAMSSSSSNSCSSSSLT